jgi:hexokinase
VKARLTSPRQDTLSAATLMPMGKGFAITSDLNLAPLLLAGYARHTRRQSPSQTSPRSKRRRLGPLPHLKIAAITNDTVATLASLAYSVKSLPNSRVAAGIIVGTGCNATIPMKLTDLAKSKARGIINRDPDATETVVNTEITISGACGPLESVTTKWDRKLDAACARPGFQPLEYMTGGRYVGELVRTVFFDYMTTRHNPPIPPSSLPATIVHSYSFSTTFVSAVVARARSDGELAGELKRRIPPPESSNWAWSPHSAGALRKIANLVQVRSAGLIAAATMGLLATVGEIALSDPSAVSGMEAEDRAEVAPNGDGDPEPLKGVLPKLAHRQSRDGLSPAPGVTAWQSGPEELVIAYTGGIIQHYPNFKEQCQRFIDRLVMRAGPQDGGKSVFLREARDGGIIGAGVLAGMETARIAPVQT